MKIIIKKIIVSGLLALAIFFAAAGPGAAQYENQAALLVQIEEVKRQILILQIQLIQMRIADLQRQLDQINGDGNVSNAYIDIIYPNGGEKLENRRDYYIRWESRGIERVTIELEAPGSETIIASNVDASAGRYYWYAGDVVGSEYRVHIFDPNRPGAGDVSSGKFLVFDNNGGNHCSDGTAIGKCSTDKPKLCFDDELDLVDACHSCGCPSGLTCDSNSKCH